jgi:hypothetical protein
MNYVHGVSKSYFNRAVHDKSNSSNFNAVQTESRIYLAHFNVIINRAVTLLKRLVAGFPPRRPGFASGQHVGFVVDKAAMGQVFSEYFIFPCQSSFHQFLHYHNHPGLAQ